MRVANRYDPLSTGQRYLIGTITADTDGRRSPLTIAVSKPGESLFIWGMKSRTSSRLKPSSAALCFVICSQPLQMVGGVPAFELEDLAVRERR
jgi:hypothetical protein